jgi:hypothetical protein
MTLIRRTFVGFALALPAMARAQTREKPMRLRCRFADEDFSYSLIDNATIRDLIALLPLSLNIEDFSTKEKLAHLPRRLDEGGLADFHDEAPGDLCYFRGWGNLAFFHADYTYRGDLIRLGRIEGTTAPLRVPGSHTLRLDLI